MSILGREQTFDIIETKQQKDCWAPIEILVHMFEKSVWSTKRLLQVTFELCPEEWRWCVRGRKCQVWGIRTGNPKERWQGTSLWVITRNNKVGGHCKVGLDKGEE